MRSLRFTQRRTVAALVLTLIGVSGPSLAAASAALPADPPSVPAPSGDPVENSVVKIFSTTERPDLAKPWAKQSPRELSGSGMVIEGRRILTNAHVVAYATEVQVQANQSGEKLPAIVESFAPGIDLAVLRLEDETFFETHPALPRAHLLSR